MNFSAVIELATLVAFVVVLLGGRDKREGGGWKIVSGLLGLVALVQLISMAIVVSVYLRLRCYCNGSDRGCECDWTNVLGVAGFPL